MIILTSQVVAERKTLTLPTFVLEMMAFNKAYKIRLMQWIREMGRIAGSELTLKEAKLIAETIINLAEEVRWTAHNQNRTSMIQWDIEENHGINQVRNVRITTVQDVNNVQEEFSVH